MAKKNLFWLRKRQGAVMLDLCLESLPIYSLVPPTGTELPKSEWSQWKWVKMSDLVAAAQQLQPERNWEAKTLGQAFESINKSSSFWYFHEGSAQPVFADIVISDHNRPRRGHWSWWGSWTWGERIPFASPNLLVPSVWAEHVLTLVKWGAVEIVVEDTGVAHFNVRAINGQGGRGSVHDILKK